MSSSTDILQDLSSYYLNMYFPEQFHVTASDCFK